MLVKLPNGLLDGVDLFNYCEIDELRGKHQNYLANQELVVGNIGHVPKILESVVLSFQTAEGLKWKGKIAEAIWKIPSGDLETIFVKLRLNTYGERFYHEATCPHCEHKAKNLRLDLDTLQVEEYNLQERMVPKTVMLPKSKKELELRPIYLKDLFDLIKITKNDQETLITSIIPLSIKSIKNLETGEVKGDIKGPDVENLPMTDIIFLQQSLDKVKLEGSIDTNIELDCPKCSKPYSMKLNVFDPSFFDPSKGSMPGTM